MYADREKKGRERETQDERKRSRKKRTCSTIETRMSWHLLESLSDRLLPDARLKNSARRSEIRRFEFGSKLAELYARTRIPVRVDRFIPNFSVAFLVEDCFRLFSREQLAFDATRLVYIDENERCCFFHGFMVQRKFVFDLLGQILWNDPLELCLNEFCLATCKV